MKSLEIIFDENPSGGCGCNCGCGGGSIVEDMNNLIENLEKYNFGGDISVDVSPLSKFTDDSLLDKINELLGKTNATFRVNKDNVEETLSNILPLIALDGTILTAYGVPTLQDVVSEVLKNV